MNFVAVELGYAVEQLLVLVLVQVKVRRCWVIDCLMDVDVVEILMFISCICSEGRK